MANPIIDRARLHFRADERRAIEVPEWGEAGAPLVLFAAPVTLADKKRLHNRYKDGGLHEMYVHALIDKAQTEAGAPAFTLDDKRSLMTAVDPGVVERIAAQILAAAGPEDAEKN
ncbi:MAG: hypothetical protein RLZZ524_850 [Pseudomonadota bacterium]|jgi:hypothetical protein